MNATTFFSESMYDQLKQDIATEKIIPIFETPYQNQVKTKGNSYEVSIVTGRYTGSNEYFVSLWHDYNYTDPKYKSRQIGGGCGSRISLDSYGSFLESINRILKQFPDYIHEVFYEQMSLF